MSAANDGGSFVVSGGPLVLLWPLVIIAIGSGAAITALKGRWGWLWFGLLFGGMLWPLTALLPAAEGSLWRRGSTAAEDPSG